MNSVNMDRYRKGLIASAHIAADELGMSEGDYRALLKAQTGQTAQVNAPSRSLGV